MDKDPIICYIRFMNCEWNKDACHKVFVEALCGWEYLWEKWDSMLYQLGFYAAVVEYYARLDESLQRQLSAYAVKMAGR